MGNLQEWRKLRKPELTLPSGLKLTLQKVGLMDLAAQGKIPAPLAGIVQKLIDGSTAGRKVELNLDELPDYARVIEVVVWAAVVDPPLADTRDDEHLGMDELTLEEKTEIFKWANGTANALVPFRPESQQPVDAALPG